MIRQKSSKKPKEENMSALFAERKEVTTSAKRQQVDACRLVA